MGRRSKSLPKSEVKLAERIRDQDKNVQRIRAMTDAADIKAESEENRRKLEALKIQSRALQLRLKALPTEKTGVLEQVVADEDELKASAKQNKWSQEELDQKLAEAKEAGRKSLEQIDQEEQSVIARLRRLNADVKTRATITEASDERLKTLSVQLDEIKKDEQKKAKENCEKTIDELESAITGKTGAPVLQFLKSSIAMQFRFDILETNAAKVDGSYKMPARLGVFTLGYAAGTINKRKGERAIGVATTFGDLLDVPCGSALRAVEHTRRHSILSRAISGYAS